MNCENCNNKLAVSKKGYDIRYKAVGLTVCQKCYMRCKRHGNFSLVEMRGRPRISEEEKKEHSRQAVKRYWERVYKPRETKWKRLSKEEKQKAILEDSKIIFDDLE
jgi:hypothetical protein